MLRRLLWIRKMTEILLSYALRVITLCTATFSLRLNGCLSTGVLTTQGTLIVDARASTCRLSGSSTFGQINFYFLAKRRAEIPITLTGVTWVFNTFWVCLGHFLFDLTFPSRRKKSWHCALICGNVCSLWGSPRAHLHVAGMLQFVS